MDDLVKADPHNLNRRFVIIVHADTEVLGSQLLIIEGELRRKHLVPLGVVKGTFSSYFSGSSTGSGSRYLLTAAAWRGSDIYGASSSMKDKPILDYLRQNIRI